jgi:hypothetical protein
MNSSATVVIFPSRSSPYVVLDVEKIRAAMDRRCVNATELAVRAGVSVPVINRILRAKPVRRHSAALVIKAILATPEAEGMGAPPQRHHGAGVVNTEEREALIEVLSNIPVVELAKSRMLTRLLLAAVADQG